MAGCSETGCGVCPTDPARGWLAALLLCAMISMVWSELDLAAARLFFRAGDGFFLKDLGLFRFIHKTMPWILIGGAVIAVLCGAVAAWRKRPLWGMTGRKAAYLAASLALGPGLVVNSLLKEHWGRARPSQIVDFGGIAQFTPAWRLTDQCAHNCAFSSGHAALGFWLVAVALLAPARWRGGAVGAAFGWGLVVGVARMAQGGHFLSDVVVSAAVTIVLSRWLFRRLVDRPATD